MNYFLIILVSLLQLQVDSLCDRAIAMEENDNYPEAVRLNQEALSLTPADSLEWISIISNNLSTEYFYLCNFQPAVEYALQALRIDEQREDIVGISCSLNQLAVVYVKLQQYDQGYEITKRAIAIEEDLVSRGVPGHKSVLAARLGILCEICTKMSRYDEAFAASERAIAIDRETNNHRGLGIHLSQKATIYTQQGRFQEALPLFEESIRYLEETENLRSYIITLIPYSQVLSTVNRTDEALRLLRECITLSYQTGQRETRLHALHEWTLLQQNREVRPVFVHYTLLRDSLFSDEMKNSIADMQVKYDTEKKELEILHQQAIMQREHILFVAIAIVAFLLSILITIIFIYARRQKKSVEEKNRMVSILSHDLKSPAVAQQRVLHLLADGHMASSPDITRALAEAQDKQVSLLLNMLDYARLEAGRIPMSPIPLDLLSVAEDVVGLLSEQARQKHITLRITPLRTTDSRPITADRTMIHTIMRNLTSNAIKFSSCDSEVEIRMEPQGFAVVDHGEGFGSHPTEKGTGLGLEICRRFARLNRASLTIDTGATGTTVRLLFNQK